MSPSTACCVDTNIQIYNYKKRFICLGVYQVNGNLRSNFFRDKTLELQIEVQKRFDEQLEVSCI